MVRNGIPGPGSRARLARRSGVRRLRRAPTPTTSRSGDALSTNALTANALTANALTANALTANALTANALTANALTANALTANGAARSAGARVPEVRRLVRARRRTTSIDDHDRRHDVHVPGRAGPGARVGRARAARATARASAGSRPACWRASTPPGVERDDLDARRQPGAAPRRQDELRDYTEREATYFGNLFIAGQPRFLCLSPGQTETSGSAAIRWPTAR